MAVAGDIQLCLQGKKTEELSGKPVKWQPEPKDMIIIFRGRA